MLSTEHPPQHIPVLLDATLRMLQPHKGDRYLDLTAGYGGHARAFIKRTENYVDAYLVDRDQNAIDSLTDFAAKGATILHSDFLGAAQKLVGQGIQFDCIVVDLGVSSPQLDRAERGFSFTHDGPLDMRMDPSQQLTAAQYVNTASGRDLEDTIVRYGEESRGVAKRYVQAILRRRPIATTHELASVIVEAHIGKWQRTHPATRTFQAIRMYINRELEQIESTLLLLPRLLAPGGRVGIISFHSLEDRLVKQFFTEQTQSG